MRRMIALLLSAAMLCIFGVSVYAEGNISLKEVSVSEGDEYFAEVVMIPEDIDFLERSTIDLPVIAEETISVQSQKDLSEISKVEVKADPSTKKGDVVGTVTLTDDSGAVKTVNLIAAESAQTIIDGLKQKKLDAIAAEDALIEQNRGTRLEYIEYAIGFVLVTVLTVIAVKAKKRHMKIE